MASEKLPESDYFTWLSRQEEKIRPKPERHPLSIGVFLSRWSSRCMLPSYELGKKVQDTLIECTAKKLEEIEKVGKKVAETCGFTPLPYPETCDQMPEYWFRLEEQYEKAVESKMKTILKGDLLTGEVKKIKRPTYSSQVTECGLKAYKLATEIKALEKAIEQRDHPEASLAVSHIKAIAKEWGGCTCKPPIKQIEKLEKAIERRDYKQAQELIKTIEGAFTSCLVSKAGPPTPEWPVP